MFLSTLNDSVEIDSSAEKIRLFHKNFFNFTDDSASINLHICGEPGTFKNGLLHIKLATDLLLYANNQNVEFSVILGDLDIKEYAKAMTASINWITAKSDITPFKEDDIERWVMERISFYMVDTNNLPTLVHKATYAPQIVKFRQFFYSELPDYAIQARTTYQSFKQVTTSTACDVATIQSQLANDKLVVLTGNITNQFIDHTLNKSVGFYLIKRLDDLVMKNVRLIQSSEVFPNYIDSDW